MDINQIFNMIDDKYIANNDLKTQELGIEEGKKVKNMSVFFQPKENNGVWENCAKIIASHTDKELERYLPLALEWFQDANWPGYVTIRDRLRKMNCDFIYNAYSSAISEAYRSQDWIWVYWLTELLTIPGLKDKLSKEEKQMIEQGVKNSAMDE